MFSLNVGLVVPVSGEAVAAWTAIGLSESDDVYEKCVAITQYDGGPYLVCAPDSLEIARLGHSELSTIDVPLDVSYGSKSSLGDPIRDLTISTELGVRPECLVAHSIPQVRAGAFAGRIIIRCTGLAERIEGGRETRIEISGPGKKSHVIRVSAR